MSWWNNTGITTLASAALKTAQKRIDKVLDIQEDEENKSPPAVSVTTEVTSLSPSSDSPSPTDVKAEDGEFWNKWLPADKLSSLSLKAKARGSSSDYKSSKSVEHEGEKGTFSTDFLTSTLSSSLTKAQQLKTISSSGILMLKMQSSEKSFSDVNTKAVSENVNVEKPMSRGDDAVKDANTDAESETGTPETCSEVQADMSEKIGLQDEPTVTPEKETGLSVTEPLKITVSADSSEVDDFGGKLLSTGPLLTTHLTSSEPVTQESDVSEGQLEPVISETSVDDLLNEPDDAPSGWGDVSLSILTESQASSTSSAAGESSETTAVIQEAAPTDTGDKPTKDVINVVSSDLMESTLASVTNVPVEIPVQIPMEASGTAWDIPELTESALEGLVETVESESKPEQSDRVQDNEKAVDDTPPESETQLEENEMHAGNCEESQISSDGTETKFMDSMQEEASCSDQHEDAMEKSQEVENVGSAVTETVDCDSLIPREVSSMEGSTDTQDELSSSNRTLTADESDTAKLSSDSSQVTLESNPEDGHVAGEAMDKSSTPEQPLDKNKMETQPEPKDQVQKDASPTKCQEGGSKDSLSSSSYVKNMLEEAMVESMKDTDSHTDSHSSSEMVRIESGPTSGHTSADEIETNTSSDIEIISHISTPNGENRLFDLSPLRHALSRSMPRNSPPGHKRSDSSSSGQSRNGEELMSPDGAQKVVALARQMPPKKDKRDVKKAEESVEVSNPLDSDKLLKLPEPLPIPLQPIQENLENVTMVTSLSTDSDASQADNKQSSVHELLHLQQKLAETAEILEARERRLMELSRENIDLQETNNILRQQLEQSEEAREAEMMDLNTLTEEFTKRMSEAEKKIQAVIKEKETMKKKLLDTEAELAKRANDKAMERIMREKDQQIAELLEEGEKLSKQQLLSNNIIKKLRVKEKETESLLKSQKTKLDEQKAEIERLFSVLDNKADNEKKQSDAISQLNNAVLVQEAEINRLKSELEDYVEKNRSLQVILDNSYKEIAELHKAQAAKASEAQELALSAEIKAKEELQVTLEQYKQQMRQEQEGLITQIEDLQLSLGRMEKEHGRREDILRQEIADLQKRLQEAEERNQELTQSVTQATRPLLRQIENLQATFSAQTASYEKVEKNLTERLTEAQTALALAQDKERNAIERVIEVDVKLSTLESQVSQLRQEKSRLQAALEMEKTKLELLEDTRNNESAQLHAQKLNYQKEIDEIRKEKMLLENQLEMEKMRTETEKKKQMTLQEQLREKEIQLMQTRKTAASPTPSFSRESSFTAESVISLSQEEVIEKTLLLATANGGKATLYESLKQAGATTILENLQAQLKMRDGEIAQLQSEIQELERTRESMARELVSLTNQNEQLQDQLKEYPEFVQKFKDLDQRYNALLMMYGEKVEEAEELRLDLQDVKDLYRAQIDELLRNK